MPTKRKTIKHDSSKDLAIAGYFADIFIVNIFRICKTLISKKPELDARLVFDFIFFGITEWMLFLLGGFKFFGMGNYHFFWIIGVIILFIVFVCGLIGILHRKSRKQESLQDRVATEEEREQVRREEYRSIFQGLEGMGYSSSNAKKATDYVFYHYPEETVEYKITKAIKEYFGRVSNKTRQKDLANFINDIDN